MLSRFLNGPPFPRSVIDAHPWEKLSCLRCMRLAVTRKRVQVGASITGIGRLDCGWLNKSVRSRPLRLIRVRAVALP